MTFVLHSAFAGSSPADTLGTADYSYRVLDEAFGRLLQSSGQVVRVADPAEADAIYDDCAARGEPCTLLSMTPPHKAPLGLRCPTVCVFAWEFNTIPDEEWDDEPRHDWRRVFTAHGRAITLSRHAQSLVREAVGDACRVGAVGAPVWTAWSKLRDEHRAPCSGGTIAVTGMLLDTARVPHFGENPMWPLPGPAFDPFELAAPSELLSAEPPPAALPPPAEPPPPVEPSARELLSQAVYSMRLAYRATLHRRLPGPGRWALSRAGRLARRCYLAMLAARRLTRRRMQAAPPVVSPPHTPAPPPVPAPTSVPTPATARAHRPATELRLEGAVWTSVFNPADGRKNWADIVSAFVWALRDDDRATLVLKLAHHDPAAFAAPFEHLLARLAPFRCRVVAIGGWLSDEALEALVRATDIVVNASHGEGLCLPLMEFMSAGRPAIAPTHTAMADYVTPEGAFTVGAGIEHNVWPHDTRDLFKTTRFRIEWDSLVDAFERSARVLREDPCRYAAMSRAASEATRRVCSDEAVDAGLRAALGNEAFA